MQTINTDLLKTPVSAVERQPIEPQQLVSAPVTQSRLSEPAVVPLNALLAKRYELKYRISETTARAVRNFVLGFLKPDPYTARQPSGQYLISSLYLDSPRLHLFQETIDDKCNRFKLRIRGYDDDPNSPVFFEIKRKYNRIVHKSRAKVAKTYIKQILGGSFIPPDMPEKDRATLMQFVHYCRCLQAKPMVLVRYKREAYENQHDSKVRITFDRELSYFGVNEPIFKVNGPGWRPLPIDFVVLEIKFTGGFPTWIKQMVQLFNLNRQSMSKYCSSIRQISPVSSSGMSR